MRAQRPRRVLKYVYILCSPRNIGTWKNPGPFGHNKRPGAVEHRAPSASGFVTLPLPRLQWFDCAPAVFPSHLQMQRQRADRDSACVTQGAKLYET
jgi:hypothetical protein